MRANVAITSPRRLSAVLCALLATACAGHPLSSAPAKENAAMSLSPHDAGIAAAEQLLGRMLKLIDSVHRVADLAPDNIERQTGLRVAFHSEDRTEYGAAGPVAQDWAYSLSSVAYRQGQTPSRLDFDFIDTRQVRAEAADTTPLCATDAQAYARALGARGFVPVALAESKRPPDFGYQGVEPQRFVRGDVEVTVRTFGDRAPTVGRACISGLRIAVAG